MSLVGLADGIWPEVVLSDEEKSWQKGVVMQLMFAILVEQLKNYAK